MEHTYPLPGVEYKITAPLSIGAVMARAGKTPFQLFRGVKFHLAHDGYRYSNIGGARISLHRAKWQHYRGLIPPGMHVHHVDHDRANNRMDNLALIPSGEHISMHGRERFAQDPATREVLRGGWHHSFGEQTVGICAHCGKSWQGWQYRPKQFCGTRCQANAGYKRRLLAKP